MKLTAILSILSISSLTLASQNIDHLQITPLNDIKCSRKSQVGDTIEVHYTGRLDDGTVFDSSLARHKPIQFKLGVGQVIKGWDDGLMDMCIGEKRTLYIPSDLAYGKRGAGGVIPPDTALIFDTELMGIDGIAKDEL